MMKEFIKCNKVIKLKSRIRFLKNCIQNNLIPTHVKFIYDKIFLFESSSKFALYKMNNMYVSKLMKLEVSDSYKHLHTIRIKIFKLYNNIHNLIPGYMAQEFFITQERICQLELIRQFNVCDKKINNLKEKHIHNVRNLKPIKFYAIMNSDNNVTISNTYQSEESYCVQLDPEEFDLISQN